MLKTKAGHLGSLLGAILLVAGTSIGGGMLALPVSTGPAGFFPSLLLMIVCWAFMTTTALLLLEANLWMQKDAHIISMSSRFLGPIGKIVSWIIFLFMGYASLVAYISGGGDLISDAIEAVSGWTLDRWMGCVLFMGIFGVVIDMGARVVGKVNAILVGATVLAFAGLLTLGFLHIDPANFLHMEWGKTFLAVPIVLTVFSFQCIVPSLTIYLNRDVKDLRIAIISGTSITLIVYLFWQYLVLGTVPYEGENGLIVALAEGVPATRFYQEAVGNSSVALFAAFFAFFAMASPFLGIGLSLFDFLSDGLKIKKKGIGRIKLGLIIAIPSLFFALFFERAFLVALETSGGFGDSILNGILPALMVWVGRYKEKLHSKFRVPGGKYLLVAVILFALAVVALQIHPLEF